jgi:hypothetical protein
MISQKAYKINMHVLARTIVNSLENNNAEKSEDATQK